MYAILSKNKIDYLKWDFNRNISDAGSVALEPERQTEFFHRFVMGTYSLMERLVTTFPALLLENCSGGGGRFDPGMLYYSPQIWTSDNTDAVDRVFIQYGTSLCYPTSTMGAHVSAARRTPFDVRGDVALWGSFGYELDPRKMTEEEKQKVIAQVAEYHKYYDVIHFGDLYRLLCPWEDHRFAVWQFVSRDKTEALVTKVTLDNVWDHFQIIRLKGLDPQKLYHCPQLGLTASGALLMNAGINMTDIAPWEYQSAKLHFVAVD
jgi:alpha-galactosidase